MLATVNIFLHGLFFLEQIDEGECQTLEIKAPDLSDHEFFGGMRGNFINLDYRTIDWTHSGLKGGFPEPGPAPNIPGDLGPAIPQFSRSETGVGNLKSNWNRGRIRLPWPKEFFPRRAAEMPKYTTRHPKNPTSRQVGENIYKFCKRGGNYQLCLVTGLAYDYHLSFLHLRKGWDPNFNIHFYFEPLGGHNLDQVNKDLAAAAYIFDVPDEFDIQLGKKTLATPTPIGTGGYRRGVNPEDDADLSETIHSLTANIAISEFEKFLGEQGAPVNVPCIADDRQTSLLSLMMISSANCPHFFVG